MIFNAVVLSFVTFIGFTLLFMKLPKTFRTILIKFDFFTDIGAAFMTYLLLGGSATGMIGAGLVGITVSICLAIIKPVSGKNIKVFKNKQ